MLNISVDFWFILLPSMKRLEKARFLFRFMDGKLPFSRAERRLKPWFQTNEPKINFYYLFTIMFNLLLFSLQTH
ncbi:hypothetical protein BCI9360_00531 [Bacillus sp. CECT 9360]|nr:hypothetical protein BCI9360_00531 [Bacillus sp. CECT 9360]